MKIRPPDHDSLSKPVLVIDSVDDRRAVNTERVGNTHGGKTVDANPRTLVDVQGLFLTVDFIGAVTGRAVVIDEAGAYTLQKLK